MKKEKYIILSAVMLTALTVLSSCEKKESNFDKDNTSNRIDFASFQSKGAETKEEDLINFGVYAYYTTGDFDKNTSKPNFMLNTKVERVNNGTWSYDPLMFWPNSGKLSFFAYAPYGADEYLELTSTTTTEGYPQITYTVPDNILEQRDLLISDPQYNLTKQTNTSGKVPIQFKHALSNIVFYGETVGNTTATVKVESIEIGNLKNKAKYNYYDPSYDGPRWEVLNGETNYTTYALVKGTALEDEVLNNNGDQQISKEDHLLMVIPQTIGDDVYLKVKVSLLYPHNNSTVVTETEVKLNSLISELKIGQKYKINIKVNLVDVILTCKVKDWNNEEIDVPDFD